MTRIDRKEVVFFGFFSHFFCILSIGTKCVNYNENSIQDNVELFFLNFQHSKYRYLMSKL
jgi:hypothetical protein